VAEYFGARQKEDERKRRRERKRKKNKSNGRTGHYDVSST